MSTPPNTSLTSERQEFEDRRLAAFAALPYRRILIHQHKDTAENLFEHGAQIRARVLGIVEFCAQKTLTHPEAFRNRDSSHPDVDAVARYVCFPIVALDIS